MIGLAPGDRNHTLNVGIVSADKRYRNQRFQFDAITNYGNSGGPVIGTEGELYGFALTPMFPGPIMGRIYSSMDILRWTIAPNSGVSFGARVDQVIQALPIMMKGESTDRLGGAFIGIAPESTSMLDDDVRLKTVMPNSAGDKAGLRKGDIIQQFNHQRVRSWKDVTKQIEKVKPGDKVEVQILRPGRDRYLEVNGKQIRDSDSLESYMNTLEDGDKIKGRYIDVTDQRLILEIEMGKRK